MASNPLARWFLTAVCLATVACQPEPQQPNSAPQNPAAKTGDAAQPLAQDSAASPDEPLVDEGFPPVDKQFEIPATWKRLGKEEIWIDREKHQVIVGGHICLRAGALEMFACPQHTKEHESVVATHTSSKFVHAALLAVGAKPGKAVQFEPEYKPAEGPKVKVSVRWKENGELRERPAQLMVRDIATQQPMDHEWLFVGSATWANPDTGEDVYLADSGELICVSNFGNAMMDLPVESSSAASGLLFEALTENIPESGTLVLLVLEPEIASAAGADAAPPVEGGVREQSEPAGKSLPK